MRKLLILLFCFLALSTSSYADGEVKITNALIYQKLLEIEKRQIVLETQFKDFKEQTKSQFEQLQTFLWVITSIFTTLVVAVIGFAYWDRRTIVRKARDEAFEKVEMEGRWKLLLQVLRELAREDKRLAEILRSFGLL